MEKFTLKDNTVVQHIPVQPIKPQYVFFPKEESQQFASREYNFDGVNNIPETQTADTYSEIITRKGLTTEVKDIPVNAANSATDYIGAATFSLPHIISENFTDFKLINTVANDFTALGNATIEQLAEDLFLVTDTDPKVVSIFNGLQAIRIPANRFNDTTQSPVVKNFGKYYIKISPKYVDVPITSILLRKHVAWQNVNPNDAEGRRQIITTSNSALQGTPWNFEDSTFVKQGGRLQGSIVEVWNTSTTVKKQQKMIAENNINLAPLNNGTANFVLHPDNVGYDSPDQVAAVGDVLRIYPRETYFEPIYIEVEYQNPANDLESLVQFMKNDVVRDLTTGVYEIYDDNGVVVDNQGNITGTVIQSYQISKEGTREVRRRLNL